MIKEDTLWRMPVKPHSEDEEKEIPKPDIEVYKKKLRLPSKQFRTGFRPIPRNRHCDNSLDKRGFKRGARSDENSMNWSNVHL